MSYSFFPGVSKAIQFEGPDSRNPLAFRFYKGDLQVEGKSMREILNPALCWWHGLTGEGEDPFGGPAHELTWEAKPRNLGGACKKADAGFELMEILGIPNFTFHDLDLVPNGENWAATRRNLDDIATHIERRMKEMGKTCLWATQNTFSEPCFTHGGGTAVHADIWAYAGCRVKASLELGLRFQAANHVFWDGRGGYSFLLAQDLERDLRRKGDLLVAAVEYRDKIGSKAQFLVEPKPKEPTILQYDSDAGSIMNFLCWYDRVTGSSIFDEFKLNLEEGHAVLAGKEFHFEIDYAGTMGKLGSLDANQNHPVVGWDSDHMPSDVRKAALAMFFVLKHGGLGKGGLNFDAKVRRGSIRPIDRVYGHILALDTYAQGLLIAAELRADKDFNDLLAARFQGWDSDFGKIVMKGDALLEDCEERITAIGGLPPSCGSSSEELFESMLNAAQARAIRKL